MRKHGAFVQDRRRDPFARIETELIHRYGRLIGANGLAVYAVLAAHANKHTHEVFLHHHTIAAKLNTSPKTVQRAIALLLKYKLLHREVRKGQGEANLYILRDVPKRESSGDAPLFDGEGHFNRTQVSSKDRAAQNRADSSTIYGAAAALPDTGDQLNATLTGQKNMPCPDKNESLTGQKSAPYKEQPDKGNQIEPKPSSTTDLDLATICEELSAFVPAVDDAALGKLVEACRERAADVRTEEIVHFVREKGALIEQMGSEKRGDRTATQAVRNPLGFLLFAVPMCFEGTSFAAWRARRQKWEQELGRKEREEAELLASMVNCAGCGARTFRDLQCCIHCRRPLHAAQDSTDAAAAVG